MTLISSVSDAQNCGITYDEARIIIYDRNMLMIQAKGLHLGTLLPYPKNLDSAENNCKCKHTSLLP
jgi:hypothetical protein